MSHLLTHEGVLSQSAGSVMIYHYTLYNAFSYVSTNRSMQTIAMVVCETRMISVGPGHMYILYQVTIHVLQTGGKESRARERERREREREKEREREGHQAQALVMARHKIRTVGRDTDLWGRGYKLYEFKSKSELWTPLKSKRRTMEVVSRECSSIDVGFL